MSLKHNKTLAQADGADSSVVRPSDWNADHVIDSGGILMAAGTTDPSPPAADHLLFYAKKVAGRSVAKIVGPSGIDAILQNFIGQDKVFISSASGNGTTLTALGGTITAATAGTAVAVASTNMATRMKRLKISCTSTASTINSIRAAASHYTLGVPGSPFNLGGFFCVTRFMLSSAATYTVGSTTGARGFHGMWATASAPTLVEPSTLTNCIGVGYGASDSNLKLFYGGSAAQTPIDLGANFPVNTCSVDVYELVLFAPPNSNNTVYYKVTRLNTGHIAEGTLTAATPGTQLPSNTTFLSYPVEWVGNNSSLAVVQSFDAISQYISTDQ